MEYPCCDEDLFIDKGTDFLEMQKKSHMFETMSSAVQEHNRNKVEFLVHRIAATINHCMGSPRFITCPENRLKSSLNHNTLRSWNCCSWKLKNNEKCLFWKIQKWIIAAKSSDCLSAFGSWNRSSIKHDQYQDSSRTVVQIH